LRFQKVICLTTAFNIKPLPEPDQQHGRLKAYVYFWVANLNWGLDALWFADPWRNNNMS
jgi:hypothetical protein